MVEVEANKDRHDHDGDDHQLDFDDLASTDAVILIERGPATHVPLAADFADLEESIPLRGNRLTLMVF